MSTAPFGNENLSRIVLSQHSIFYSGRELFVTAHWHRLFEDAEMIKPFVSFARYKLHAAKTVSLP
jgi:hypothetical protein